MEGQNTKRKIARHVGSFYYSENIPMQFHILSSLRRNGCWRHRNITDHIIPKLAWFHIEFEGIHPFIDGNVTQRHQQKAA